MPARSRRSRDLQEYERKRAFTRTPEPAPATHDGRGPLTFVVQKHAASRLHYDFRLEAGGTLKSWAVPKGPSLDPAQRRLAVAVEDHPLDYATFEGVIPKGQYGAGQDIVWDNGTYSPDEDPHGNRGVFSFHDRAQAEARVLDGIAAGKLSLRLRGSKLKGSWALVKTSQDESSWLLIKHRDPQASTDRDVRAEEASVLSGRTIEELKRGLPLGDPTGLTTPNPADLPKARLAAFPAAPPAPMLAASREAPPNTPGWLFEPKIDGIRLLALVRDGEVTLRSRRGLDLTAQYPAVAAALAAQPAAALLLDGEVVAPKPGGVPSFELLQQRMNLLADSKVAQAEAEIPVVYFAFDLLHVDGVDVRAAPLWQRKELLRRLLDPGPWLQPLDHIDADGNTVFQALTQRGFEGVVAKRRDGPYLAGKRSPSWLKVKARAGGDFLVGGYTPGRGRRAPTFGALLLGERDADGCLVYAGRVGSGFSDAQLTEIRALLELRERKRSPFHAPVPEAVGATYARPDLVVEVRYADRTSAGQLRAPVFLRLRDDKPPDDVRLPTPTPEPAVPTPTDPTSDVIAQLDDARAKLTLELDVASLPVSNLDKVLWPAHAGAPPVRKRDLLRFLLTIAPQLLPQLRDRPLTLTRFPNGIAGKSFYQKHWTQPTPAFVQSVAIYSEDADADQQYLLCNNLPTLLWLGQIADLGFHTSLARIVAEPDAGDLPRTFTGSRAGVLASVLNYPDVLLFDLDPFVPAQGETESVKNELTREGFAKASQVARWLKTTLDAAHLQSFVKTSGASGLHIFVPIVRNLDYAAVRAAAETIAKAVLAAHPNDVAIERRRRAGKVYIDLNQNGRIKALAAAYSPRAKPGAPVSMPLRWDEVGDADPSAFTVWTAADRVHRAGDLWAGLLDAKQDLRALFGETG